MVKKRMRTVFAVGLILCMLTGCGKSTPTGEMVNNKGMINNRVGDNSTTEEEKEIFDIPVGSSYVKNEAQGANEARDANEAQGANEAQDVNETDIKRTFPTLSELREEVKQELGDHYWPEISISEEELEQKTGITRNMYIEFLAENTDTTADMDMMIIIHAKEDYVGTIEQALEDYRLKMIEENNKHPQNLCKVEASRMETVENYICFVQLGADTNIVAGKGKDEIISYCLEENERAVDILEKAILR